MRFLVVLGVFLVLIFIVAYFVYSLQPSDTETNQKDNTISTSTAVQFKIEKGEGIREIASRLSNEKLIRSITAFKFYTIISGTAHRFLPGSYTISNAMSIPEIVKEFTYGGKNETTVVIPEGTTIRDVEDILIGAGALEKGVSLPNDPKLFEKEFPFLERRKSLEGFIFPDTYRVPLDAPPEVIVRRFLETFERKAWPILKEQDDWYDRLIISSILEREVITFEDRQIVTGIFLKRMSIGMPIQADATISYEKCDGKYRGCKVIRMLRSDTKIPSPYNTYQNLGLPPTPIANPGQSAIRAAIEPKKTQYLYYLSARTGETMFSKTFDEHNIKRAKYL